MHPDPPRFAHLLGWVVFVLVVVLLAGWLFAERRAPVPEEPPPTPLRSHP